jgi:hypothetical protein
MTLCPRSLVRKPDIGQEGERKCCTELRALKLGRGSGTRFGRFTVGGESAPVVSAVCLSMTSQMRADLPIPDKIFKSHSKEGIYSRCNN